ncbi:hypothetical protein ILUMI_13442 [Ignelater luminosus]|uniref:DUF4371 domain-containing protein n=1 Tax=Ignelater luminosus TaxID=2038154 RepID=A0A8K0GBF6_IGNLU|nr:hypothetical protein ILUMI_13442 [Ignelater luminosus]
MDTTQDIAKVDQLSQVIRYVTIEQSESGRPTDIKINESFLGFKKVEDGSADIIDSIKSKYFCIDLSKCRGQVYDGAAVMSGPYSGVQKRILDEVDRAVYVYCAAHNLNLVLNDAINGILEVSKFFATLEKLYAFFAVSIKRWALLYADILQALAKIILTSNNASERTDASNLKKDLESFEFVFQVVLHTKILIATSGVSQNLQKSDFDFWQARDLLQAARKELEEFRGEFEKAKSDAVELAKSWGIVAACSYRLLAAVKKAAEYRRKENVTLHQQILSSIEDMKNAKSHVFGQHDKYKDRNCEPSNDEVKYVPVMSKCDLYKDIQF